MRYLWDIPLLNEVDQYVQIGTVQLCLVQVSKVEKYVFKGFFYLSLINTDYKCIELKYIWKLKSSRYENYLNDHIGN